jgi:propanol-preferring alcohol dehydrogenase
MISAKIVEPKEPLEIRETKLPKPRGSQVLVRVLATGVCHSDIHLWEGGYEGPEGQFLKTTDRGILYPLTPGHEIAGIVEEIGDDLSSASGERAITRNDEVIVYPWIGEGVCPACRGGEENLCDSPKSLGIHSDGGYAEFVLVPHYKYLVKINAGNDGFDNGDNDNSHLDPEIAAILPCSALTAYGAVRNAALSPRDNVVVVGAGGLGLMAIQIAKAVTGANVTAIDLEDEKLSAAKRNGADHVINSKDQDPAKIVSETTGKLGADAVIDFVNSTATVEKDMQLLRRRARLVFVGFFGGELKLNLVTVPTRAYRLIGSYTGSLNNLIDLVSLAKRGVISPVVSHRFKLSQATEALEILRDRKITGRAVITP